MAPRSSPIFLSPFPCSRAHARNLQSDKPQDRLARTDASRLEDLEHNQRSEGVIAESDRTIFQEEAQRRSRAGANLRDVRTSDVWPGLERQDHTEGPTALAYDL